MLYPEIIAARGFINALNNAFERIGSKLRVVTNEDLDRIPFTYARVENDNRFTQIYLAAEQNLYLSNYWKDGVSLAHGNTDDINSLVESVDFWLCKNINSTELAQKFSFVSLSAKAETFDDGREVRYAWHSILIDPQRAELKQFIDLVMQDEILSTLFPFTSLTRLCFSRCTGYPYTYDLPVVIPLNEHDFEVRLNNDVVVGRGNASQALKMVKENLPNDIKPAIKGTANNFRNST